MRSPARRHQRLWTRDGGEVPRAYREPGKPVLLASSVGAAPRSFSPPMEPPLFRFASASRGADWVMSRKQARKAFAAREIKALSVMERAGVTRRVAPGRR